MQVPPGGPEQLFAFTRKKWEGVDQLDKGGQGAAFRVRKAEARQRRSEALGSITTSIQRMTTAGGNPGDSAPTLASAIGTYNNVDPAKDLCVLKVFLEREGSSKEQIRTRFQKELEALQKVNHPSILRLVDADSQALWMVTEYQPNGNLEVHRSSFVGQALKSLLALRPVVEAVSLLHTQQPPFIHRDIKPNNILMAADGRLVLADFGIVFSESADRATELIERVGNRDWIAPWFNVPDQRIDDVRPSFDVYMLGKVLWWMISGKMTAYWHFDDKELNLENLFPDAPAMSSVNALLSRCMVRVEAQCCETAKDLLGLFDECIAKVRGHVLSDDIPRACLVCSIGRYEKLPFDKDPKVRSYFLFFNKEPGGAGNEPERTDIRPRKCNRCGHLQLFYVSGRKPPAWLKSQS